MSNGKKARKKPLSKILIHTVLILFSICCILPIILILSISLTNDNEIMKNGYSLIPRKIDLSAYKLIFQSSGQLLHSYFITICVTVIGTICSMWLTTSYAYVISRKDYKYKSFASFYLFFTMLFNGGLVPWFILISRGLHLYDNILVLFIPYLVTPWFVLLMKGFLQDIPSSIIESAKIDGASELKIFTRLIIPLSKPAIATIGIFNVLLFWNDWWLSLLFIENKSLVSLQFLLYRIMSSIDFLTSGIAMNTAVNINTQNIPTLSARMAMCVLAAGPMLFVFPFFQKHFVKGMTVGSIKG